GNGAGVRVAEEAAAAEGTGCLPRRQENGKGSSATGDASALEVVQGRNAESAEAALYEWVLGVARATARNRSSMLQDVAAGRRTEVDYLSGWVLRVAAARGVAAPVNGALYGMVRRCSGVRMWGIMHACV
ncbi:hypothetical protein Agub_g2073, partial [Astrephomene gubernaculifera]